MSMLKQRKSLLNLAGFNVQALIHVRNAWFLASIVILLMSKAIPAFAETPLLIAMSDEVRTMCQQAEGLINAAKFSEAQKILKRAASIDPNCAEVYGYLGMAEQNSGHPSAAIDYYKQALQINPQMSFLNINVGTCYLNLNQIDAAVPYLESYVRNNPNAPDAAQARAYIQQASSRKGQQNLRPIVEQGQALLNQGKFAEAIAAFEHATSIQNNFAPAHFFLAYALAQSGQLQRAIAEFQVCLQLDPSTKDAILNIGSNYQSLGDCKNAIVWYERYIKEAPNSPKVSDIKQRIAGLQRQLKEGKSNQSNQISGKGIHNQATGEGSLVQGNVQSSVQSNPVHSNPGPGGAEVDDYLSNAGSNGQFFRWSAFPVRVCIMSGVEAIGYRDSFYKLLMDSFTDWSQASQGRLAFVLEPNPSRAQIICNWTGDPEKIIEQGRVVEGGLTKLSAQVQTNGAVQITGAQMTLLTNRKGSSISDYDMKKVCLHEVGHALGINGHSNDNHDIMFFTESPTVQPNLSRRDKSTISRLYFSYPKLATAH